MEVKDSSSSLPPEMLKLTLAIGGGRPAAAAAAAGSTGRSATSAQPPLRSLEMLELKLAIGGGTPAAGSTGHSAHPLGLSLGMFEGKAGGHFTAHVVTVNAGEIFSSASKGHMGLCTVLSANGDISKVILRQPGSSSGVITYEGRFHILSLSGAFVISNNGSRSPTNGLRVSLAGLGGHVIGGGVAGSMTAAGPINIIIGSFLQNRHMTHKNKRRREESSLRCSRSSRHLKIK